MAKLYFDPNLGTFEVRRDDEPSYNPDYVDQVIEVTPEQGSAITLSVIAQILQQIAERKRGNRVGPMGFVMSPLHLNPFETADGPAAEEPAF